MNFTAIDFETAKGPRWSVCQVGIVRVENSKIVQTYSKLIKPPKNEYFKYNTMVHGISSEITSDAPVFAEIWPEIMGLIENQLLVAHNAEFDIDCLCKTLILYKIKIPEFNSYCTYKNTGESLEKVCQAFSIDLENHHDALSDAIACAKIYLKLMNNETMDFSKITSTHKNKTQFSGHEKLSGSVLKPNLENGDKNSCFYGKKVLFTGVLESISRENAAEIVCKLGADIDTCITKKTNYVIMGRDAGPSKIRKIEKYNSEGSNICIIHEDEFKKLITIN